MAAVRGGGGGGAGTGREGSEEQKTDSGSGLGFGATVRPIGVVVVKDGRAFIQAGGGIVADSIPEKEFQETINKSRALVKAVELAETGF